MPFFFFFRVKPEVLPCIHMAVSHLRSWSMVCQQGKNKAELMCCTQGMGREADSQHTALTAAAKHPRIKVECAASSYTLLQLSSWWRQQGKLQRTRHKTLHLQVPWPLQGLSCQQETDSGPDMRKHSTTVSLFRNKSSHSFLLTHMFWATLESSRFPRMSSAFWKLLLPRHKQEGAAPAELLDTAVSQLSQLWDTAASLWVHSNIQFLLVHKPRQLPGVTCSGGVKPGWLHQFSRVYSERKSGFGWKTPFSMWKKHTFVCFFQYRMFLVFILWLNFAVTASKSTYKHNTTRGSCSAFLDLGNYTKSAILQGAGMSQKCTPLHWESATKTSVGATSFQLQVLYTT